MSGDTGLRRGPMDAKEKRKLESRFESLRGDFMVTQVVFENESVFEAVLVIVCSLQWDRRVPIDVQYEK